MPSVRFTDSDGFTTIPIENWPDIFAGVNSRPRKFCVENNGSDRAMGNSPGPANGLQVEIDQIGTNDGSTEFRIASDSVTLSPPFGLTAVLGPATGVWGVAGTYGWKITAVNATGETIGSFEVTFNVTALGNAITLTWNTIAGATNYKIYRTPTPGTYGASTLVTTVGAVGTFNDTGAATTSGTPPTKNTTAGWTLSAGLGGAGGVWGATGNNFWVLAAYDSTNVLIAISLEATFNVTDTTKKVTLSWPTIAYADHYILYRSGGSGSYISPAIRATIAAGIVSFDDDGSALTTGGITYDPSFGIPPAIGSFGTGAIQVYTGHLEIGKQFFFWGTRIVPNGTSEQGNPRSCLTTIKEI